MPDCNSIPILRVARNRWFLAVVKGLLQAQMFVPMGAQVTSWSMQNYCNATFYRHGLSKSTKTNLLIKSGSGIIGSIFTDHQKRYAGALIRASMQQIRGSALACFSRGNGKTEWQFDAIKCSACTKPDSQASVFIKTSCI